MSQKVTESCEKCKTEIIYAYPKPTFNKPFPNKVALNSIPQSDGNVVYNEATNTFTKVASNEMDKAKELNVVRYQLHSETCKRGKGR